MRISGLDEHLHLYGVLVITQGVTLHSANLDLPIENRAVAVERAEPLSFQRDVQPRHIVTHRRLLSQGGEAAGRFALTGAESNVVT